MDKILDKEESDGFLQDVRFLYEEEMAVEMTVESSSISVNTMTGLIESIIDETPYASIHNSEENSCSINMSADMSCSVRQKVHEIENSDEMKDFKRSLRQDMYANIVLQECEENIDISEIERSVFEETDSEEESFVFKNLLQKFEKYAQMSAENSHISIRKASENFKSSESIVNKEEITGLEEQITEEEVDGEDIYEIEEKDSTDEEVEEELLKKCELTAEVCERTESTLSFLRNEAACLATPPPNDIPQETAKDEQVMEDLINAIAILKLVGENDNETSSEVGESDKAISKTSIGCQVSVNHLMTSGYVQTTNTLATTFNNLLDNTKDGIIDKTISAPALLVAVGESSETSESRDPGVICEEPQATVSVHLSRYDIRSNPSRELNAERSSRMLLLTKVSDMHASISGQASISAPCEREFHTIHIQSEMSPPPSIMDRQPLCTRFWNVLNDFCLATCVCLQVNKPCIFCMLLFFVFFVSSYILIFTIYGILNADTRMFQHNVLSRDTDRFAHRPDFYSSTRNMDNNHRF